MLRRTPLRKKRKGTSKHKAWDAFSKFVRQRDADHNGLVVCISCGSVYPWQYVDAGHFVAASVSLALRFNEKNVNGQCKPCNQWDHKSIHGYTLGMIKKYGPEILEELNTIRREGQGFRISEPDYRDLLEKYDRMAGEISK